MSQDPFTGAISIRPPAGLAGPRELGPLVRAQPVRDVGDLVARFGLTFSVVALAKIWSDLGMVAAELGTMAALLGTAWAIPVLRSWWRRWRMRRIPLWNGSGPLPEGVVRVTGRVRAVGEPFLPPGESQPVIYAHTRFAQASPHGGLSFFRREDVRGLFLEIDIDGDVYVRIAPETVRLLDRASTVPEVGPEVRYQLGAPSSGWWQGRLRRSILHPGDMVEAIGEVVREVNTQGAASPGRGVPMVQWLTPAWKGGVWIRRLEQA